MSRRNMIIIGVLVVIALLLFIVPRYVFKTPAATTTTTPTTTTATPAQTTPAATTFPLDTATITDLTTQAGFELDYATARAKEWEQDSALTAVMIKYTGSIAPKNGKDTYIFSSPSVAAYYYTIAFNQLKDSSGQTTFDRIIYYKDDYFLPKDTIVMPQQYWKLSFLDALKKADDLGGKDIRRTNTNHDVTLLLSAQQGKYLIWTTEYTVSGERKFFTTMNSFNGDIY